MSPTEVFIDRGHSPHESYIPPAEYQRPRWRMRSPDQIQRWRFTPSVNKLICLRICAPFENGIYTTCTELLHRIERRFLIVASNCDPVGGLCQGSNTRDSAPTHLQQPVSDQIEAVLWLHDFILIVNLFLSCSYNQVNRLSTNIVKWCRKLSASQLNTRKPAEWVHGTVAGYTHWETTWLSRLFGVRRTFFKGRTCQGVVIKQS